MGVDAVAIRSSAEADEHRRNRRAVEDVVATRNSGAADAVAIRNSAEVDAHRLNRPAVVVAVATRSSAVVREQERATDPRVEAQGVARWAATGGRGARHRWTVRAVRQVAARWPVVAAGDGARAQALAEAAAA